MPIYNPYNEVVQPAKYVAPMDLNLLLKGTQYKQEQSEKNFNEIQGQVNNLLSIPAYGKDKEILNQKLQELQQVMGGLDVTNLETPQAKQQINSLINQFSQDKDVQAVAQRGNSYQNMMAEKQDFDKKGKVYMNQGLRKLNKYYSGDDYIRDVKFSNYGYEAPDAGKIMEEVKKIVTPSKKQVPGLNGTMQEIEEYEPKALQKAFEAITNSMPTYKQSLIDNLDNSLEGQDVNELAIKKYQPLLAQYQQNETNAMWLASQTSDPALKTKYLNDAQSAREGINSAQQVLQNPYSGLAYKQAELSSLMNQDLKNMTDALTFHKEGERKMTDVAKMNAEHAHDFAIKAQESANRMKEELYKTQNDLFPYLSKGEQDVFLGKAKGEIDWSNAGKKLLEVKQKESLGSKLDDWQSKKDYEAEYKLNQENRQAIDDYLTKNTTTDDTTPAFQTSAATGERLIKENLSTIIPYIAKLSEEYKNLNASDIDKIEYKDGNYRLHTKGVFSNNQDITPNQFSKALTEWKKDNLKTPELAKPENSSGKVYKGLDPEGNVIFE